MTENYFDAQTDSNGHEYVDLGLPSGTLWATCNIGATKPEEYGNYYAWGETEPKDNYEVDTYKYANKNLFELTTYCILKESGYNGFTDNLTELQGSDDPAAANWGGGWRTPSKTQWDELVANTTHQWTTRGGKKGMLYTSKKNGQTLFLPAAGGRDDNLYADGTDGFYWSRSLDAHKNDPWFFMINTMFDDALISASREREIGHSVRPVRSARQN